MKRATISLISIFLILPKLYAQTNEQISEQNNSWFSGITSQMIIIPILICSIFFLLFLFLLKKANSNQNSKVSAIVRRQLNKMLDEQTLSPVPSSPQIEKELSSLRQEINNLGQDIKNQNERIGRIENTAKPKPVTTPAEIVPEAETPTSPQSLYFSTPSADGSFKEDSMSLVYKEGASIYRFTKTGDTTANFRLDEKESSVNLAIQFPDKNIEPVCEPENAFNPNSRKIVTKELGEAELQNGKWVVHKKAKIRYE